MVTEGGANVSTRRLRTSGLATRLVGGGDICSAKVGGGEGERGSYSRVALLAAGGNNGGGFAGSVMCPRRKTQKPALPATSCSVSTTTTSKVVWRGFNSSRDMLTSANAIKACLSHKQEDCKTCLKATW